MGGVNLVQGNQYVFHGSGGTSEVRPPSFVKIVKFHVGRIEKHIPDGHLAKVSFRTYGNTYSLSFISVGDYDNSVKVLLGNINLFISLDEIEKYDFYWDCSTSKIHYYKEGILNGSTSINEGCAGPMYISPYLYMVVDNCYQNIIPDFYIRVVENAGD